MAGEGLRIGLLSYGEGIGRGIRSKNASLERGLWYREGERRRQFEYDRDRDDRLIDIALQKHFQDEANTRNDAIGRLSDAIGLADTYLYDDPNYLTHRQNLADTRKGIITGDVDPKSVTLPRDFLTSMAVARKKMSDAEAARFDRLHPPETPEEDKNAPYYVVTRDDGVMEVITEKERGRRLSDAKTVLNTVGLGSDARDKAKNNILNLTLSENYNTPDEAVQVAKYKNVGNLLTQHLQDQLKIQPGVSNLAGSTSANKVASNPTASFDEKMKAASADTQKKFEGLEDADKKFFMELIKAGDDPDSLIVDFMKVGGKK